MRTNDRRASEERKLVCIACSRSMQPEMVPWIQHTIGCPVRTAELSTLTATRDTVTRSSREAQARRAYAWA